MKEKNVVIEVADKVEIQNSEIQVEKNEEAPGIGYEIVIGSEEKLS